MALRAAVVGGGTVSKTHLTGLERNPLVELVAVCDIDERRATELAESYGITAYTEFEALLNHERLDWLHVCTPVQTHRDLSIAAIEAGIPVLIEKPVTVTAAEFEDVRAAAVEHDVPVSVVRNHLFGVAVMEARERLAAGDLGDLRGVDVIYTGNTRPDEPNRGAWTFDLPGGEFEEGIPHPIYLGLGVGGNPASAEDVSVTTSCYGEYEREFTYDGFQCSWVTEAGALCSVKTLSGSVPQRLLLVHGEEGSLSVDVVSQTVVELDRDYKASPVARALNNLDRIGDRSRGTLSNAYAVANRRLSGDWEVEKRWNPHYYQFDLEARALLDGTEPAVSLEHVAWTQRLVDAVRTEADETTGRTVTAELR